MDVSEGFKIKLAFRGRTETVSVSGGTTASELADAARAAFPDELSDPSIALKLISRGKQLGKHSPDEIVFQEGRGSKATSKVVVMASSSSAVLKLNSGRSDPLMRGFDNEKKNPAQFKKTYWGQTTAQHRDYKFVRLEACTWQSFGTRPNTSTPHDYRALEFLERLSTDPGIVAIMVERELVVNTLGEMDPVDDRLMEKHKQEGGCLLGYNTNHGLRIDIKLRPDNLEGFLPYNQLAATLIHELSHNWVGDHNALFWANYGQMRVEYFYRHATFECIVDGKSTASLAGISEQCQGGLKAISENVQREVAKEMMQHGVPLSAVASAIVKRCEELEEKSVAVEKERKRLGGDNAAVATASARALALAAAERRAQKNVDDDKKDKRGAKKEQ
jgi:hypothetical protein